MSILQNLRKRKTFNKKNLSAYFSDKAISNNVTYTYLKGFKDSIDFDNLLAEFTNQYEELKAANSKFSVHNIIDYMLDAVILGYSRFSHMEILRDDIAYAEIRGKLSPSEKVCRDLIKLLPEEAISKIRDFNKSLLSLQAKHQGPREVMIDVDDTVVTVFGNQEKACIGYNPKYHGRPSFKEKFAMISGTKELVDLSLEEGNHHSNHNFIDFLKGCEASLPDNWYLKRIRGDKGFFDQRNLDYFEEKGYEYLVKAKMTQNMKKIVDYINENQNQYPFSPISEDKDKYYVSEITVPLPSWEKARRLVIIRKTLPVKIEGQLVMDEFRYEYQAIVTNIDYLEAKEIFHDYNQRCTIETSINELKTGFAFSENSQINHKSNEIYLILKMIAYNLHNWFKEEILPEKLRHHGIRTLQRILYRTAGVLTGKGWYRRIVYQSNKWLEDVIKSIQKLLYNFQLRTETG